MAVAEVYAAAGATVFPPGDLARKAEIGTNWEWPARSTGKRAIIDTYLTVTL